MAAVHLKLMNGFLPLHLKFSTGENIFGKRDPHGWRLLDTNQINAAIFCQVILTTPIVMQSPGTSTDTEHCFVPAGTSVASAPQMISLKLGLSWNCCLRIWYGNHPVRWQLDLGWGVADSVLGVGQSAAIAASVFGAVERLVGAFEHGFDAVVAAEFGNAAGDGDGHVLAAVVETRNLHGLT